MLNPIYIHHNVEIMKNVMLSLTMNEKYNVIVNMKDHTLICHCFVASYIFLHSFKIVATNCVLRELTSVKSNVISSLLIK